MKKVAAICGTEAVYGDMLAVAKSLVYNSSVDEIHLFTEHDDLGELPDLIKVHNAKNQTYFKPDGPNMKSKYSYMAMMRAALCHELPDTDLVLSLDTDVFAVANADKVWDIDVSNAYFAAAPEWHRTNAKSVYCNTGVALYNLKRLRDGKADEVIQELNTNRYEWVEQDVFSYRCQGFIAPMPAKYNANYWTTSNRYKELEQETVLLHYAGKSAAEWRKEWVPKIFSEMPWSAALAARS